MSAKEWKERQADAHSTRRNKIERSRRAEFDRHYGKQHADGASSRNIGGFGKGDKPRPLHQQRYEIGLRLATDDLTDEERKELTDEWYRLGGIDPPSDDA